MEKVRHQSKLAQDTNLVTAYQLFCPIPSLVNLPLPEQKQLHKSDIGTYKANS